MTTASSVFLDLRGATVEAQASSVMLDIRSATREPAGSSVYLDLRGNPVFFGDPVRPYVVDSNGQPRPAEDTDPVEVGTVDFQTAEDAPGGGGTATNATVGGSGPANAAAAGWMKIRVNGAIRWIQFWE